MNNKNKFVLLFLALFLTFGMPSVHSEEEVLPVFTLSNDPTNPFIFNMNTTYDTGSSFVILFVEEYYFQVDLDANTPYVFIYWSSMANINLTLQKSDNGLKVFSENERNDNKFINTFEVSQAGTYNLTIESHEYQYKDYGGVGFHELQHLDEETDLLSYTPLSGDMGSREFTIAYIDFNAVRYYQVGFSYSSCYLFGDLGTGESVSQALNESSDFTFDNNSNLTIPEAGRYVVYSYDDRIYKIYDYTGGDDPIEDLEPIASFTASSTNVDVDEEIFFIDASNGGNNPLSYYWDFGDGVNSTEQNSTHNYNSIGNYTVNLTVTDDDGDFSSFNMEIEVSSAPTDDSPNDIPNPGIPGFSIGILFTSAGVMIFFIQKYITDER